MGETMPSWLPELLDIVNKTLTAAVVVITVSLLLYNLSRNLHNRVTRSASILLGCVTLTYALDALLALDAQAPGPLVFRRAQWLGIAFTPAALFHLADALLATTGLPSRGRRLSLMRVLYATSAVFAALALFSDTLVHDVQNVLRAKPFFFAFFTLYFLLASAHAFILVQRARFRCLTRGTRRRMALLQISLPTASIAIFPYSALLAPGEEFSSLALILVSLANATVILLLIFLSYPLSYFGTEKARPCGQAGIAELQPARAGDGFTGPGHHERDRRPAARPRHPGRSLHSLRSRSRHLAMAMDGPPGPALAGEIPDL